MIGFRDGRYRELARVANPAPLAGPLVVADGARLRFTLADGPGHEVRFRPGR